MNVESAYQLRHAQSGCGHSYIQSGPEYFTQCSHRPSSFPSYLHFEITRGIKPDMRKASTTNSKLTSYTFFNWNNNQISLATIHNLASQKPKPRGGPPAYQPSSHKGRQDLRWANKEDLSGKVNIGWSALVILHSVPVSTSAFWWFSGAKMTMKHRIFHISTYFLHSKQLVYWSWWAL